jgi:signal peptidase II
MPSAAMARLRGAVPWLCLALAVAAADRASKVLIEHLFAVGERRPVLPFFDLVLVYNKGAAFSFLAGAGGWQTPLLIAVAAAAIVVLAALLLRHPQKRLLCTGLALVLGGALGNLWDRIVHGHVADFILLYAHGYYFPAFNLADSAITVGAGLLIYEGFFHDEKKAAAAR